MNFKQVALSLALATTAIGAQAFTGHPEHDFDLRSDVAQLAAVNVTGTAPRGQVVSGNPEHSFDQRAELAKTVYTPEVAAAAEWSDTSLSQKFSGLQRITM